jgi:VWFA-related protein
MHLRNDRVLFLLIAFIFSNVALAQSSAGAAPAQPAQNAPATTQPQQNAPVVTPQTGSPAANTPVQQPQTQPAPAQTAPPQTAPATGQAGQTGAEESGTDQGGTFVFRKEVQEVVLHATVVDDKNRLVTNLGRTAFTVYEDNVPQQITDFRHQDIPVAMGIVIDNSGSMREKRAQVNAAALNLVRASNPQDEVFVVNFNDEYYLDQDFTGNIAKLKEALEKVEARGGTALYDAIVASADHLAKNSRLQRKVLFVVTDGEDNASRESLEQAVHRLQQENGPTVYAIGILGDERSHRAKRALEVLADRTGGIAFLPKNLSEVDEISSTVAHDIRNQYTIGYKPSTPKSAGGYRTIHVTAKAKGYGRLTVRTRSGYYPGHENAGQ